MTQRWESALPPVDLQEMLRYAACRAPTEEVLSLARSAAEEGAAVIRGRVCYTTVPVEGEGDTVHLGPLTVASRSLAATLRDCHCAVLMAATVGLELDRLIARYGRLSPARGLMLQALGAERIEALCDAFCDHLAAEYGPLQRRFSPGYGDLPLTFQKPLFAYLECQKQLGLYLTESCMMRPGKSVTAIVGVGGSGQEKGGCGSCQQKNCAFRRKA